MNEKMFGNLLIGVLILGLATFAHAFGKDKFEEELEEEQGAVKQFLFPVPVLLTWDAKESGPHVKTAAIAAVRPG